MSAPKVKPTRQDSLFLLNNNTIIDKYLKSNKYKLEDYRKIDPNTWTHEFNYEKKDLDRLIKEDIEYNEKRHPASTYKKVVNNFIGTSDWASGGGDDHGIPFQYLHPEIAPQYSGDLVSRDSLNNYKNIDMFPAIYSYGYEPLAITPWDMLNKKQRELRLKTYGTSGTPFDKRAQPNIPLMPKRKQYSYEEPVPLKTKVNPVGPPLSLKSFIDYSGSYMDQPQVAPKTDGTVYTDNELAKMGYRSGTPNQIKSKGTINKYKYGGPIKMSKGGIIPRCDFGGIIKDIGAGAYGIAEGAVDAGTMGLSDSFTDMGAKGLDIENNVVRDFGNIGGAAATQFMTFGMSTPGSTQQYMKGAKGIANNSGWFDKNTVDIANKGIGGLQMATPIIAGIEDKSLNPTTIMNTAQQMPNYINSFNSSSVPQKAEGGETIRDNTFVNLNKPNINEKYYSKKDYDKALKLYKKTIDVYNKSYLPTPYNIENALDHITNNKNDTTGIGLYNFKFQEGGPVDDKTMINVEGGELEIDPSGKILKEFRNKPKHPAFGIDEEGNTMSTPGNIIIPKTTVFGINTKKYKERMYDPMFVNTAKHNLKYNQKINQMKEEEIQMAKYGGKIMKYGGDGPSVVGPRADEGFFNFDNNRDDTKWSIDTPMTPRSSPQLPSNVLPLQIFDPMRGQYTNQPLPSQGSDWDNSLNKTEGVGNYQNTTSNPQSNQGLQGKDIAGAVATYGPVLYNLGRSLFDKPVKFNSSNYTTNPNLKFDPLTGNSGRNDMKGAYASARAGVRNLSGTGAQLQALTGLTNKYFEQLGKFNENLENTNKMGIFEASKVNKSIEGQNAQTRFQTDMFNEQSRANKRNFGSTAVSQASQAYQAERNNKMLYEYLNKYNKTDNTPIGDPIFAGGYNTNATAQNTSNPTYTPSANGLGFNTMWKNYFKR